jgi:sirohydrochlorin ferrochelatase
MNPPSPQRPSPRSITSGQPAGRPALLLVGHGTRDERGRAEFAALTRQIDQRLPDHDVLACFLEFAEPTIEQAIDQLAAAGTRQVTVMPLLLFAAGHAKRDIPAEVAAGARRHPQLTLRVAAHLGCHAALVELSALRFRQLVANGASREADDATLLLLVGRGSRDADANAEMARFSRLRFEAAPVGWIETCHTAMAEPSLERALTVVGGMPFSQVVVQPHLLFAGELVSRVGVRVAEAAERFSDKNWLVTPHLGAHNLVVQAVLDRSAEVKLAAAL